MLLFPRTGENPRKIGSSAFGTGGLGNHGIERVLAVSGWETCKGRNFSGIPGAWFSWKIGGGAQDVEIKTAEMAAAIEPAARGIEGDGNGAGGWNWDASAARRCRETVEG